MGKIRVKTFGDEEEEKKQQQKLEARKQAKKLENKAVKTQTQENAELEVEVEKKLNEAESGSAKPESASGGQKKDKFVKEKKAPHSKNYQNLVTQIDKTKTYALSEALELLEKLQRGKFDETVELHVNTLTPGISGNVTLPNGTGKKTKVAVATDTLISEIEKGKIDFDILVAQPEMMPKLARVAKVLGPKGLMPNPKNGTITERPQDLVKKYEGGQINFKTESKSPILHLTVGKVSFGQKKLSENIETLLNAIKKPNIINATLKSTMSPGIKLKI